MTDDPVKLGNQPALTTSTGRIWLIVGGLFTAIALAVLIPMTALAPPGVALAAAITDVLLYAGMLAARFAIRPGRLRLGLMAVAILAIATLSLVGAVVVAAVAV